MANRVGNSTLSGIGGPELRVELETGLGLTPSGLVEHPQFFSGIVARPEVVAAGVLTVADVAATTYLDLSALAMRDPVVTASGDRLRFESFSGCNGVHVRFDLLAEGIASGEVAFGTTNVDINQPLRSALAALPRYDLLHLAVGAESLRVSTLDETHEERKVELPQRWVRGFAEVPTVMAEMSLVAEAVGTEAMTFLAGLPKGAPGPAVGVVGGARGLRVTALDAPGSATLAGTARLGSLRRIMRHIRRLSVWRHEAGFSAWVADVDGGRITLVMTPQPYRGFSGEGQLLLSLSGAVGPGAGGSGAEGSGAALRLLEHLAWEPVLDAGVLGAETGLSPAAVASGIAVLAASGKVGFDLADAAWFHREIPYDADAVDRDHPRLVAARKLVAEGNVRRADTAYEVGDGDRHHWVPFEGEGRARCTCRWYARYQGDRGPCSHILAVTLLRRTTDAPEPREIAEIL